MKQNFLILVWLLIVSIPVYGQWNCMDYKNGRRVQVDSITYRIRNDYEKYLDAKIVREKGVCVTMQNVNNYRMGGSQYADGTMVNYSEHSSEVAGIIIPQSYYHNAIYHAVRSAFSKEEELIPYADECIFVYLVVDNQGNIVETCCSFFVWEVDAFQPEQIATLESLIRKNLKFELSPKARNFNYFEGQITIPFRHYIEDLPYLEGGNLTDLPKAGGGN